jgi:hypothetical protein
MADAVILTVIGIYFIFALRHMILYDFKPTKNQLEDAGLR